ncbi:MAG: choline dehydrogenase [Hyphomicrobiaceae bacterium]
MTTTPTTWDFIIVGSGSAGGFLALRLSENPAHRVLVIEAGLTDRHWTTEIPAASRFTYLGGPRNWCFETEPEPHMDGRRIFQPRGKTIGGSSSINGMVFVRGHARDFDGWAAEGATGWAYKDVLPYFKRLESYRQGGDTYRGDRGPVGVQKLVDNHPIEMAFLEAGAEAGHARPADYNGAEQEGVSAFDVNVEDGWRSGTARACIGPARRRPNVTVLTEALATRVLLDGKCAVGVSYNHRGESHVAHAAREVILSAGAFGSPQLLMLSGIGPAEALRAHDIDIRHHLPGVGENLHDHLEVHLKHRCPKGMSKNHLMARHKIVWAGIRWYLAKSGPAATSHSRVGGFFRSDASRGYPDIQFHFWPWYLEGWSPPPSKDGYCFDVGPVRTESRGSVRLASADPRAAPRIMLNGLSRERDLIEFRAAIRLAREIADQKAFDFCRGPEVWPGRETKSDADLDAFVRANAASAYHPCGSCKMGTDAMAVVDPLARVHGIDGLRVADASIMPRITNGNLNAPTMMIGERVADLVLKG